MAKPIIRKIWSCGPRAVKIEWWQSGDKTGVDIYIGKKGGTYKNVAKIAGLTKFQSAGKNSCRIRIEDDISEESKRLIKQSIIERGQ